MGNGFDAELRQRRATGEWYLWPRFVCDTLVFTVTDPYFLRPIVNLGAEILPFYELRNLLPQKAIPADERPQSLERRPSQPSWDYEKRADVAAQSHLGTGGE